MCGNLSLQQFTQPIEQPKHHRRVTSCHFYRLVATCQQVATSLSISSSCNKSVKIRLAAICHLQTYYNLLKQLATSLLIASFDNHLSSTSCRWPCESILTSACCNKLSRCQQACCNMGVFGCVNRSVDIQVSFPL